jgi:hypothetical protein
MPLGNEKFSTLPGASPLGLSDIIPVTQGATSKQATYGGLWQPTPIGNANYTIQPTDVLVYTSVAFTAARTWTLPLASTYGAGRILRIADALGTLTTINSLTLTRQGSDTIGGLTSQVLAQSGQSMLLVSDAVSRWTIVALGQSAVGNSYQAITMSAAGNTNSTQGAVATQFTMVTVTAASGVCTLSLPHTNISAGDGNFIYLNVAAGIVPVVQIFDNNTGGTLLFEWDGDGQATSIAVVCAYNGSTWYLADAHFFA